MHEIKLFNICKSLNLPGGPMKTMLRGTLSPPNAICVFSLQTNKFQIR